MNMNTDLVNRALYSTGQTQLSDEDIENKNDTYKLCASYYISTFLEALSEVEWVGGRRRVLLVRTGRPVRWNKKYRFAYDVPFDCAKPIELQDNGYFVVEDKLILTDTQDAELLYVSNGKILREIAVVRAGTPFDALRAELSHEYFTAGPPGSDPDVIFHAGSPWDLPIPSYTCNDCGVQTVTRETLTICPQCNSTNLRDDPAVLPEDPESDEDFPDYIERAYEPKFFQYVEMMLAAKFAVKITDQPRLHAQLLQEAMKVKQEAIAASRSSRSAKVNPSPWWEDQLGLKM
jgi:hypothetical protein